MIGQMVCNCLLILATGVEFDNFVSAHILLIRCQQAKYVGINVILVLVSTRVGRGPLHWNTLMGINAKLT